MTEVDPTLGTGRRPPLTQTLKRVPSVSRIENIPIIVNVPSSINSLPVQEQAAGDVKPDDIRITRSPPRDCLVCGVLHTTLIHGGLKIAARHAPSEWCYLTDRSTLEAGLVAGLPAVSAPTIAFKLTQAFLHENNSRKRSIVNLRARIHGSCCVT